MAVPMDYHVWNTMLQHYQRHMTKLANVMPRWKTVLSTIQNDLLHEFIDKNVVSFCNRFQSCVAATAGHWHTEWAIGIWRSWLKHFYCWWKAVKNLICYSCIFNVHLKKSTLKFKLLYLRNYISYFSKIIYVVWILTVRSANTRQGHKKKASSSLWTFVVRSRVMIF